MNEFQYSDVDKIQYPVILDNNGILVGEHMDYVEIQDSTRERQSEVLD
jgi:hypothetical protein